MSTNLTPHNFNEKDEDGFPINDTGSQVNLVDEQGNIFIPLQSNFFIKIQENSGIKFNPKDKLEVNLAIDTLVSILTQGFCEKLESYYTIDLTDKYKRENRIRTVAPAKILTIQMYFDWINKWLNYFGNVFNFEFKLFFYSKYKEKIKNDVLLLETGLKEINAPKSHIIFARRWIEETDKNIELETKAKTKRAEDEKKVILQKSTDNSVSGSQKNQDIQQISSILKPLSGKWSKKLILKENDYSRLIQYTLYINDNNNLPPDVIGFPNTGTTIEFIRKTIHCVYLHTNRRNKSAFVKLLHLFQQLDNTTESTTSRKFSAYAGDYNNDIKDLITF